MSTQEQQPNKNIPFRYILNNNLWCLEVIKKCLKTKINKTWMIIIFPEDNLQIESSIVD